MLPFFYRMILALHPPQFRRRFSGEMLSIFEQSRGSWSAVPILLDATASLFRQWTLRPEFWTETSQPAPSLLDGIPSFSTIDPFRPRASAVVPGLLLSIAVFSLTCVAIKYSWIHVLHVRIPEVQFEAPQWTPPNNPSDFPAAAPEPQNQQLVANPLTPPATGRTSNAPTEAAPVAQARGDRVQSAEHWRSQPQQAASALSKPVQQTTGNQLTDSPVPDTLSPDVALDAAAKHRVIDGAAEDVAKYYADPVVARTMSHALRMHEKNGDDNAITDGAGLSELLTSQMRAVSHDQHVEIIHSEQATPEIRAAVSSEEIARYRTEMQRQNCTFEKVEILPHNIGYLKLNSFPDASICGSTARTAMAKLNHADAIIFDLRDNPGGYANMVALLATYLFDRPTHLNDFYDRAQNSSEESWTLPPVPGNELANKPVFVVTSHTTFSAAEAFSYDLKMMKRATLIGETTSGRGHMGAPHRIDDHFTIRVPGIRVTNPVSGSNWEGTGVEPDVKVKSSDALKTAIRLAEAKLRR